MPTPTLAAALPSHSSTLPFQEGIRSWMVTCFGAVDAANPTERNQAQAAGATGQLHVWASGATYTADDLVLWKVTGTDVEVIEFSRTPLSRRKRAPLPRSLEGSL